MENIPYGIMGDRYNYRQYVRNVNNDIVMMRDMHGVAKTAGMRTWCPLQPDDS